MHVNIRPVKLRKPSGTTLVTVALLILLPTLAILQYQWVGQLSTAARERLQRNVRIAAAQFREGFDGEIIRAILSLQVGPATVREGVSERYSDRYNTWLNTAAHPQIVSNVLVVDGDNGQLRLRRWNPDIDALEATEWRPPLDGWRPEIEQEFRDFSAGRIIDRRPVLRGESSLVLLPLAKPRGSTPTDAWSADGDSGVRLHDHRAEHAVHPRADAAGARVAALHACGRRRLSCRRYGRRGPSLCSLPLGSRRADRPGAGRRLCITLRCREPGIFLRTPSSARGW